MIQWLKKLFTETPEEKRKRQVKQHMMVHHFVLDGYTGVGYGYGHYEFCNCEDI